MNMDLLSVGIAMLLVVVGGIAAIAAFRLVLLRQKCEVRGDLSQGNASLIGFYLLMPWLMPTRKVTYTYRKRGFKVLLGIYGLFTLAEALGGGVWLSTLSVRDTLQNIPQSSFGPTSLTLLTLIVIGALFILCKSYIIGNLNHWEKPVEA